MKRRFFLKSAATSALVVCASGFGFLKSAVVKAATMWPKEAFAQKTEADGVKALFGDAAATESADVQIKAPLQAENGAVVPVRVTSNLPDTETIAIFVEKNPAPFITSLNLHPGAGGVFSSRIKMGTTSKVSGYVKAGGNLYVASQEIKVTVGGCGG